MKKIKLVLCLGLFIFSGCYKNHLYVQQEWVDREFLASSHVGTPDYRQKDPPQGQEIIVSWDFPLSQYQKEMQGVLTVRFWNNIQDMISFPIEGRKGTKVFYFEDKTKDKSKKILTYKIDILSQNGEVLETWEHQFWKKRIDFQTEDQEEAS